MTTVDLASPAQEAALDTLASENGYRDRHHAASDVLQRSVRRVQAGLSRNDAARVIAELDVPAEHDGDTEGPLAGDDPERKWAIAGTSLAGTAWMFAPGAVVTWVASVLAAVLTGFWLLDQIESRLPTDLFHREREEES